MATAEEVGSTAEEVVSTAAGDFTGMAVSMAEVVSMGRAVSMVEPFMAEVGVKATFGAGEAMVGGGADMVGAGVDMDGVDLV